MKKLLLFITTFIISLFFTKHISAQHTINTSGMTFVPNSLVISAGENVTFVNTGGFHNVNGSLASYPNNPQGFGNVGGVVGPGVMLSNFTFGIPGTYNYHCDPHLPGMVGQIIVNPAQNPSIDVINITNPTCAGTPTGEIEVNINQTIPTTPIEVNIIWENPTTGFWIPLGGATASSNQPFVFTGMVAGNWLVTVTDTLTGNIIDSDSLIGSNALIAPDPLVVQLMSLNDPTNILSSDGSIDITVIGGTPGYTYLWQEATNNFNATTEDIIIYLLVHTN